MVAHDPSTDPDERVARHPRVHGISKRYRAGVRCASRYRRRLLLSALPYSVGTPEQMSYAAQYPARTLHLSMLWLCPSGSSAGLWAALGR